MKCIKCGTDNNLKDRTANFGRCSKCNHPFAFEPTSMGMVRITDPFFERVVRDLSANDTLFFTPKQFLYFFDNRLKRKRRLPVAGILFLYFVAMFIALLVGSNMTAVMNNPFVGFIPPAMITAIAILLTYYGTQTDKVDVQTRRNGIKALFILGILTLVGGGILSVLADSYPGFVLIVLLGMTSFYLAYRQRSRTGDQQRFLIDQNQLDGWLFRWQEVNDPITKLLSPPREESTPAPVNPDVTAYSFDRLVVCNSAAVAQVLIANNFHFENNCAILSITGYPQSIFDTTMEMLRRNPDLKVYAFHDCTPRGLGLVHHLRSSSKWFADSDVEIFDVGLLPGQVLAAPGMFVSNTDESGKAAQQMPNEVRQTLSATELAWLEAGNFVELESFTPQRLIQVLNRAIAGSRDLGTDHSFLMIGDTGYYSAAESFG